MASYRLYLGNRTPVTQPVFVPRIIMYLSTLSAALAGPLLALLG